MSRITFTEATPEETDMFDANDRTGVRLVQRNSKLHRPVNLPFVACVGALQFKGRTLTLDAFEVDAEPVRTDDRDIDRLDVSGPLDFTLRVDLFGFVFEFDAQAQLNDFDQKTDTLNFAFTELSTRSKEALHRLVRSYHSGYIPNAEDLLEQADHQTDMPGAAQGLHDSTSQSVVKSLSIAITSLVAIAGLLVFIAMSIYQNVFLIEAKFATVTAPQVEMMSAEIGQVRTPITRLDQSVNRDDPIYTITSSELASEYARLEARAAYLRETITDTDAQSQSDLERELSLTEGELRALDVRRAALIGYAPCDCLVKWFQEDGGWVIPGDTVVVLANRAPDTLRIEALVHLSDIDPLALGQTATVDLASGETVTGVVERITLDAREQPRVGFPQWLRQEATLASVILTVPGTLNAAHIGLPVDVQFRRSWR